MKTNALFLSLLVISVAESAHAASCYIPWTSPPFPACITQVGWDGPNGWDGWGGGGPFNALYCSSWYAGTWYASSDDCEGQGTLDPEIP